MISLKWVKWFKSNPGNDEGSNAKYACLPTKYIPIMDPEKPKEKARHKYMIVLRSDIT